MDKLMSVKELADYLNVDKQTIYHKVDKNEVPFKRIGKTIRFSKEEIDGWLMNKK